MTALCPDCSTTLRLDRSRADWTRLQFGHIVVFLDPEEIALSCFGCGWTGAGSALSLDTRTGEVVLESAKSTKFTCEVR